MNRKITEKTFGLLGFPLSHSFSALIHNTIFKIHNKNYSYILLETPTNKIKTFLENNQNLSGFNVTMPYKNYIYSLIKNRDETASFFKTTNTILKEQNNSYKCYNTDYFGFVQTLKFFNVNFKGKILLLGLGGAGKIVATTAIQNKANLTVAVRKTSKEKATKTLKELFTKNFNENFKVVDLNQIPKEKFNIIVNATPVGMSPNTKEMPLNQAFLDCETAIDLIYNPSETLFLKSAKKLGAKTINGLMMLIFQAVASFKIFTNSNLKDTETLKLALKIKEKLKY